MGLQWVWGLGGTKSASLNLYAQKPQGCGLETPGPYPRREPNSPHSYRVLGGSWVVLRGVIRRATKAINSVEGLIAPHRTSLDPKPQTL